MKKIFPLLFLLTLLLSPVDAANAVPPSPVLITAIYANSYDTRAGHDGAKAIQFQSIWDTTIDLSRWQLSDNVGTVRFPDGAAIQPHQKIWASQQATAFRGDFGFNPDYEYGGNSDASVPDMTGAAPKFDKGGGVVILQDAQGQTMDAVPYGSGTPPPGWAGPAVAAYSVGGKSVVGQILYRKMRESDGLPVPDTNAASDWSQDPVDDYLGKRPLYPGWDLDEFYQTAKGQDDNVLLKYCVAPDNLFECYRDEILAARHSIDIEAYTLDNAAIVDAITQAQGRGVTVRALLDTTQLNLSSTDPKQQQGRWACMQIENNGGQCWFMIAPSAGKLGRRYDSLHIKLTIVDGTRVLIGSENVGDDAMPNDDKRDGTFGTRGGYVITDSPTLRARAQEILNRDLDPVNHGDIKRWGWAGTWPNPDFVPTYTNGGNTYPVQFPQPFSATGKFSVELVQCPDNCLRTNDALIGLVNRAGAGDMLLVEQLYEYKYWGAGSSNLLADPNLRLVAYINAARRGARVEILLDSKYDSPTDPRGNEATCIYVNGLSAYYPIECRLGNPTGNGIHNKMVLLQHGATGFVHLGSINGSETSSKLNRELATQVESRAAYDYWAKVFGYDWSVAWLAPHMLWLPWFKK